MKARSQSVVVRGSKSASPDRSMPRSLIHEPISIDEHATSHIFTYYVGKTDSRGLLSFLPGLLSTDPSFTLQATIKAIGLASLSRIHNLPHLRRLAGQEYCTALLSLNQALQNPVTAKSDSTLATVTLFSMYEVRFLADSCLPRLTGQTDGSIPRYGRRQLRCNGWLVESCPWSDEASRVTRCGAVRLGHGSGVVHHHTLTECSYSVSNPAEFAPNSWNIGNQ